MKEQYKNIENIYKKALELSIETLDVPDNDLLIGTFKGILNEIFKSNEEKRSNGITTFTNPYRKTNSCGEKFNL